MKFDRNLGSSAGDKYAIDTTIRSLYVAEPHAIW